MLLINLYLTLFVPYECFQFGQVNQCSWVITFWFEQKQRDENIIMNNCVVVRQMVFTCRSKGFNFGLHMTKTQNISFLSTKNTDFNQTVFMNIWAFWTFFPCDYLVHYVRILFSWLTADVFFASLMDFSKLLLIQLQEITFSAKLIRSNNIWLNLSYKKNDWPS